MKRLFMMMLFVAVLFSVATKAQDTLTANNAIRNLDARVVQLESLTEHLQAQVKVLQARLDSMARVLIEPKDAKTLQTTGKETSKENQCKAVTKKGTRCTRTVTDGTGYCWQHKK